MPSWVGKWAAQSALPAEIRRNGKIFCGVLSCYQPDGADVPQARLFPRHRLPPPRGRRFLPRRRQGPWADPQPGDRPARPVLPSRSVKSRGKVLSKEESGPRKCIHSLPSDSPSRVGSTAGLPESELSGPDRDFRPSDVEHLGLTTTGRPTNGGLACPSSAGCCYYARLSV